MQVHRFKLGIRLLWMGESHMHVLVSRLLYGAYFVFVKDSLSNSII